MSTTIQTTSPTSGATAHYGNAGVRARTSARSIAARAWFRSVAWWPALRARSRWPRCNAKRGKLFAIVTQSNRDLEPWESDLRFWYCALAGKTDCDERSADSPGFRKRSLRRLFTASRHTGTTRTDTLATGTPFAGFRFAHRPRPGATNSFARRNQCRRSSS